MDMMQSLLSFAQPAVAVVAVGVGLDACGLNVLKVLKVHQFRLVLQYVAGVAGLVVLLRYFNVLS